MHNIRSCHTEQNCNISSFMTKNTPIRWAVRAAGGAVAAVNGPHPAGVLTAAAAVTDKAAHGGHVTATSATGLRRRDTPVAITPALPLRTGPSDGPGSHFISVLVYRNGPVAVYQSSSSRLLSRPLSLAPNIS